MRIWNKKCRMEKCEFTANLKSLVARFSSIMSNHFSLNLKFSLMV